MILPVTAPLPTVTTATTKSRSEALGIVAGGPSPDGWRPGRFNDDDLDCLASDIRLNVDFDTVLTLLAQGCYRWLATPLHGFGQAKHKRVDRKFVETPGAIAIESRRRILVHFERRACNPVLREAQLDKDCPPIPWLGNRRLEFGYP